MFGRYILVSVSRTVPILLCIIMLVRSCCLFFLFPILWLYLEIEAKQLGYCLERFLIVCERKQRENTIGTVVYTIQTTL